jgi:hypothetical protein
MYEIDSQFWYTPNKLNAAKSSGMSFYGMPFYVEAWI